MCEVTTINQNSVLSYGDVDAVLNLVILLTYAIKIIKLTIIL